MNNIRRISMSIIAALGALLLTACGGAPSASPPHPARSAAASATATATATPAPLPSPSVIAAPTRREDAYNGAKYTVIRYDAVADDAASGRASDALIGLVAAGSAAHDLHLVNSQAKRTLSGHSVFSFFDWSVSTLAAAGAAPIPQGRVTLTGCVAGPGVGEVAEKRFTIDYSKAARRWLVSSVKTLDGADCPPDDVNGRVAAIVQAAKEFNAAQTNIGKGANARAQAANIAKGDAADILQSAEPGALAAVGGSGFEVRFVAHYQPDGRVAHVDDAMDVFGCLGRPPTLYIDSSGQMWPAGQFGYLDISHVTTDDKLYVTGLNYTADDECDY